MFDLDFKIAARDMRPDEPKPYVFDGDDEGWQAFAAGFERQNYFSHWIAQSMRGVETPMFPLDWTYDPLEDEANIGYLPDQMVQAYSANEAAYMRAQIDTEYEQMRKANANGYGTAGEVLGSIIRPDVALSLLVPYAGWGRVLALETALEVGSEAILHQQQMTRTAQESMLNIASVTVMTGVLGKASDMMVTSNKVPAASTRDKPELDDLGQGDSAGAARVENLAVDDELVGAAGLENLAIGPMARLSTSGSDTARVTAGELADKSFYTKGMVEGKTSGVTVEAEANAAMGEVVNHLESLKILGKKSGMVTGIPGFRNYTTFNEQVGIAMRSGDKHANASVQEAAEMLRKNVFAPRGEAALELGHNFGRTKGARSYLPRMYKKQAIAANYNDLKHTLVTHYQKAFSGQRKESVRVADEADQKIVAAATTRETELDELIAEAVKIAPSKRTAAQTVKLDALRKELKSTKAKLERVAARGTPAQRLSAAQKQLKTETAKKSRSKVSMQKKAGLKARIGKLEKELKMSVKMKAGRAVEEQMMTKADIAREADQAAKDTIQNMIGGLPIGHGVAAGVPNALRQRTVAVTDRLLEPYLEQDVSAIVAQYTSGMDPYLLMSKRFGDNTLSDQLTAVGKEYQAKIDIASTGKERTKLMNQRDSDIKDLQAMRDRILHRVQRAVDPSATVEKVVQGIKAFNIATQLGGIVLSSAPDLARPLMAYGFRSHFKGVYRGMGQLFRSIKGDRTNEVSAQVRRLGIASQRALNSRLMEIADMAEQTSGNAAVNGLKQAWGKVTLFDAWTDAMETVAAQSAMDWTLRIGKKVAREQLLTRSETMKIARMGFTDTDVANFYKAALKTGGEDPGLRYANTLEWGDPDLGKLFEAGIGSDVRRAIVRIGHGDKPLMMDSAMTSLIFQYMSFAMASTNRMLVAGMQQRDFALVSGLLSSLALGATVGMSKGWLRGDDVTKWDEKKLMFEAIDRTGMMGLYNIPMNAIIRPLTGDISSRYLHRGMESVVGGSTISQIGRAGKIMQGGFEGDWEKVGEQGSRLIPFYSNALHMRQLMQQLGDS